MTGYAARHELLTRMRDVVKAIRLFKNQQPPRHRPVPGGTFGVLASIGDVTSDGCHLKELATHCALDPSTVSRAVAALVHAGLVRRTADPDDGRASVLALTDHGRQVLEDVTGWYDDLLAKALQGWTTEELATFAAMLRRFSDDLIRTAGERPTLTTTLEAAR